MNLKSCFKYFNLGNKHKRREKRCKDIYVYCVSEVFQRTPTEFVRAIKRVALSNVKSNSTQLSGKGANEKHFIIVGQLFRDVRFMKSVLRVFFLEIN